MEMVSVKSPLIDKNRLTTATYGKAFLSAGALKIIALTTMLIDHFAAICLSPNTELYFLLRFIGRISFPIYAFLLTEGYLHTSNRCKYLSRLMGYALIAEIPYNITFYENTFYLQSQNIFFELAAGLFAIYIYNEVYKNRGKLIAIGCVFVIALIAEELNFGYGALGIMVIMVFHWFRSNLALKNFVFTFIVLYYYHAMYKTKGYDSPDMLLMMLCSLSTYMPLGAVPISFYNGKKGNIKWNKNLFYIFYPIHLIVLYVVKCFFKT